jgi:hypothetical protein
MRKLCFKLTPSKPAASLRPSEAITLLTIKGYNIVYSRRKSSDRCVLLVDRVKSNEMVSKCVRSVCIYVYTYMIYFVTVVIIINM